MRFNLCRVTVRRPFPSRLRSAPKAAGLKPSTRHSPPPVGRPPPSAVPSSAPKPPPSPPSPSSPRNSSSSQTLSSRAERRREQRDGVQSRDLAFLLLGTRYPQYSVLATRYSVLLMQIPAEVQQPPNAVIPSGTTSSAA